MQRDFADQIFFNATFGSFLKERKWREKSFESSRSLSEFSDRLLAQQHYEKHSDEHKQGAKSTVFKICFFEKKPA